MLDIRHLRHLIAIAEEGTLQKASEKLHITQPALTKSMKTLENDLDAQLFERGGRRLHLTDIARELVKNGRQIVRAVRDTEDMVNGWRSGMSGQITIGLGPAYTVLLAANLIEKILADHGAVSLQIETGDTRDLLERLLDDTLHLAVCDLALPPGDPDIVALALQPQPIVGLVRKRHPLCKLARVHMADLGKFPVAHSPAPAQFSDFSTGLSGLSKSNQAAVFLSNNYEAFATASESTDLVTLLPLNLAMVYRIKRNLEVITLEDLPQKSSPKILYREGGQPMPPVGKRIIEHIRSLYA